MEILLQQFHTQFKNLIDPKDISVLVRLPNKGTGAEFNTCLLYTSDAADE